jgi:hypothetical protein
MMACTKGKCPRPPLASLNNNSRSETPVDGYRWYDRVDSLRERMRKTDERRQELLSVIYSKDVTSDVKREWIELLKERNKILQLSFEKENESSRAQFVKDLRQILKDIPHFSKSQEDQSVLTSLVNLQEQLSHYSRANSIASPAPLYSIRPLRSDEGSEEIDYEPKPAPPPAPPINIPTIRPTNDMPPNKRVSFLHEITSYQKGTLKHINVPRTPGGTPRRPALRIPVGDSPLTHGDIIQRALLKKFQSVHVHSTPKNSPGFADSNRSIGTWSDRYASDPDLTHIGSDRTGAGTTHCNPSIPSPSFTTSPPAAHQCSTSV